MWKTEDIDTYQGITVGETYYGNQTKEYLRIEQITTLGTALVRHYVSKHSVNHVKNGMATSRYFLSWILLDSKQGLVELLKQYKKADLPKIVYGREVPVEEEEPS